MNGESDPASEIVTIYDIISEIVMSLWHKTQTADTSLYHLDVRGDMLA